MLHRTLDLMDPGYLVSDAPQHDSWTLHKRFEKRGVDARGGENVDKQAEVFEERGF